jgi:hypothetical protein
MEDGRINRQGIITRTEDSVGIVFRVIQKLGPRV